MVVDSIDHNDERLLKSFLVYSGYEEIRSGVETGEFLVSLINLLYTTPRRK